MSISDSKGFVKIPYTQKDLEIVESNPDNTIIEPEFQIEVQTSFGTKITLDGFSVGNGFCLQNEDYPPMLYRTQEELDSIIKTVSAMN